MGRDGLHNSMFLIDLSTEPIPLQRGVRQGYVISAKLFIAALEDVFMLMEYV